MTKMILAEAIAEVMQLTTMGMPLWHVSWRAAKPILEAVASGDLIPKADKDAAYLERNKLVALLAAIFPSGIKRTAIPGWSDDWHGCVYIDFPWGQASWHYHDSHADLFAHLPPYDGEWNGHTTAAKYDAIVTVAKSRLDLIPKADAEQAVALAYQRALDVALVVAGHHKRMASHGGPGYGIEERMAAAAQSVHDAILALAPAEPLAEVARLREALSEIEALDDNAECCGQGVQDGYSPPECCGSPTYGLDRAKLIARAALAPQKDATP